jgi:hypothetical protein
LRLLWPRDARGGYRILNAEVVQPGQEQYPIVIEDQDGRSLLALADCCLIGVRWCITPGAVCYRLYLMADLDAEPYDPQTPPP